MAAEELNADKNLVEVERGIDLMMVGIRTVMDNIDGVKTDTDEEKSAIEKVKDLFDTGVNPFFADILQELSVVTGEDNDE